MRRFSFAIFMSLLVSAGACFGEAPLIGGDPDASTDTGSTTSDPSTTTTTNLDTTSTTGPDESSSDSGSDAGAEVGSVGEVDSTEDPPIDCGDLEQHRVFVTDNAYPILSGGWSLDAFDAHCEDEASMYGLVQAGRTFRAIVSDSTTSARQRLVVDCGPVYKERNGTVQVAEPGVLWEKGLEEPIDTAGNGDTISANLNVWTGTEPGGHSSAATCDDWSGSVGSQGTIGRLAGAGWTRQDTWLTFSTEDCDQDTATARFYCIEQPQ